MELDPFDDILGLEDRFYDEGFQLGTTDGAKAGRIEGRVFGLEKGFEKYVEIAKLHGRSLVWASRLPKDQIPDKDIGPVAANTENEQSTSSKVTTNDEPSSSTRLPKLPSNPRLEKHIKVLYALTEPVSLSTDNSEDAVSDFDNRLKRAIGKVKIIERLVGEERLQPGADQGASGNFSSQENANGGTEGNIEDISVLKARH